MKDQKEILRQFISAQRTLISNLKMKGISTGRKEEIKVGEELKCLYGLSDDTSIEDKVRLLNLLGELYFECKEYEDNESNYREVS